SATIARLPPSLTPFPYTTLFRSGGERPARPAVERRTGIASRERRFSDRRSPPFRHRDSRVRTAASVARSRRGHPQNGGELREKPDRKSTRLNSSHVKISYAVFCL